MSKSNPVVTGPTSDISNFYKTDMGNGHGPFVSEKDIESPGTVASSQFTAFSPSDLSKLQTHHQREGSLPLLNSDPTCTPPVTAGRQRTLILCFDGTGDQYDDDNSNIVNIFSMLKKDEKDLQMCYYQPGIGTYADGNFILPGSKKFATAWDAAVAWSLDAHVQGGYEFLMQNYAAGDRVCLFGFSRGAYTARALAGMLHKVGLLPAYNKQQIPFAWKMYKDISEKGWTLSRQFKKAFCTDVNIDFVGVFDTVSSVGMLGKKLPFAATNYGIRIFRHAMALDEHRARFKVAHWTRTQEEDCDCDTSSTPSWMKKGKKIRKVHGHVWKEIEDVETDVKEVWFAGCHCDVGGGSVSNEISHRLANIPLRWMIRETFRCHTGILWNIEALKTVGLDDKMLYPDVITSPLGNGKPTSSPDIATPETPAEKPTAAVAISDPEHHDALSPMFDQLAMKPFWWVLEVLPVKGKKQRPPPGGVDDWMDYTFVNFGKGRLIPRTDDGSANIHRSVKTRIDHDKKYRWKAIGNTKPVWVD